MSKSKVTPKKKLSDCSDEEIVAALDAHFGIVASAANTLGCARETLSRRISASDVLKKACGDAREKILDLAENTLVTAMREGDITAAIFVCKTLGKKRGFIEKQEISIPEGVKLRWATSGEAGNDG